MDFASKCTNEFQCISNLYIWPDKCMPTIQLQISVHFVFYLYKSVVGGDSQIKNLGKTYKEF